MAITEKAIRELEVRVGVLERLLSTSTALVALEKANEALIEVKAIQKSTHQVVAIPTGANEEFQKQFEKITGLGKEDFSSDLERMGFGNDVEDQV